jgi:hypothetical protein
MQDIYCLKFQEKLFLAAKCKNISCGSDCFGKRGGEEHISDRPVKISSKEVNKFVYIGTLTSATTDQEAGGIFCVLKLF